MVMMHTFAPVYLDAFARLLAQPDPKDLLRRGHLAGPRLRVLRPTGTG